MISLPCFLPNDGVSAILPCDARACDALQAKASKKFYGLEVCAVIGMSLQPVAA